SFITFYCKKINKTLMTFQWIKFNDEDVENKGLVESGDESSGDRWLHIVRRNSKPYFAFFYDDLIGDTFLSANKWWYLTFTWNATTKERKIYVNGILDASDISSGLLTVTSGSATGEGVRIARFYNSFLNGTMDEIIIYDRVLSEMEISTFYQKGLSR
ncbi:MAG: LamG domain-containing protein, partial [Candidatus Aenigmarchaeota archaeon]|nr:LamG domain-containing protein [Candidatus Aenigmarchaeota archaeon]